MTEQELQQYIRTNYPKEDEGCEWKEFKSLKNDFNGKVKDDVVSYVSALANMEGGHLVVGVADKTLEIVGTDTYNYDVEKARLRLTDQCANLPSEGLLVEEFVTDDTQKMVWVIHVPKHICRRPVYAHSKAWMRLDDSLVEMTDSRLDSILNEVTKQEDWTAEVIPEATIDDLDPKAIKLAREKFVELHPHREQEVKDWDDATFLNKAKITIVRDMHYAQLLANHPELTVHQITLLDKVQKGMMLTDVEKADIEEMIAENRDGTLGVLVSNDDRLISLSDAIDKKDVVDAVVDKLTERQLDIYNMLLRSVVDAVVETAESIAVKIGCSSRTVQRDLAVLQKLGLIQREGADNGGRWIVCRKG